MPKVSVIVPNYNHARYLPARLNSILQQTFQDFELIILDDCSSDGSRAVIEEFRSNPKISHIVFNEKNSGSTFKQWNKGVALANGDYVWIAESDDEAEPQILEVLVALLESHPNAGMAYCKNLMINEASEPIGMHLDWTENLAPGKWQNDFIVSGRTECEQDLFVKNIIPNASAVVFRRSIFCAAGGASEDLKLCGDWMTWFNMLLLSDLAYSCKQLNRYRFHQNNVRTKTNSSQYCYELARLRCHMLQRLAVSARNIDVAKQELLAHFKASIYLNPNEAGWSWMLKMSRYIHLIGGSRLLTNVLNLFVRHRLRYGLVGGIYRHMKNWFKVGDFSK